MRLEINDDNEAVSAELRNRAAGRVFSTLCRYGERIGPVRVRLRRNVTAAGGAESLCGIAVDSRPAVACWREAGPPTWSKRSTVLPTGSTMRSASGSRRPSRNWSRERASTAARGFAEPRYDRSETMGQVALREIDGLVRRVEAEYREMPGLSLTAAQAQRIWGIDRPTCDEVLDELTSHGFLRRTPRGTYGLTSLLAGVFAGPAAGHPHPSSRTVRSSRKSRSGRLGVPARRHPLTVLRQHK